MMDNQFIQGLLKKRIFQALLLIMTNIVKFVWARGRQKYKSKVTKICHYPNHIYCGPSHILVVIFVSYL